MKCKHVDQISDESQIYSAFPGAPIECQACGEPFWCREDQEREQDINRMALKELAETRATLAEREAEIERLKAWKADHQEFAPKVLEEFKAFKEEAFSQRDEGIERLRERVAYWQASRNEAIERALNAESSVRVLEQTATAFQTKCIEQRDEARLALATARAEALEEAAKVAEAVAWYDDSDPAGYSHQIARRIRALADTKEGGGP